MRHPPPRPEGQVGFTSARGWRPTTSTRSETAAPLRASTPYPHVLTVLAGEPLRRESGEPFSTQP